MIKKKTIIIALLIILAAVGIVIFVALIMNEPKNDFDGILVRGMTMRGVTL